MTELYTVYNIAAGLLQRKCVFWNCLDSNNNAVE